MPKNFPPPIASPYVRQHPNGLPHASIAINSKIRPPCSASKDFPWTESVSGRRIEHQPRLILFSDLFFIYILLSIPERLRDGATQISNLRLPSNKFVTLRHNICKRIFNSLCEKSAHQCDFSHYSLLLFPVLLLLLVRPVRPFSHRTLLIRSAFAFQIRHRPDQFNQIHFRPVRQYLRRVFILRKPKPLWL